MYTQHLALSYSYQLPAGLPLLRLSPFSMPVKPSQCRYAGHCDGAIATKADGFIPYFLCPDAFAAELLTRNKDKIQSDHIWPGSSNQWNDKKIEVSLVKWFSGFNLWTGVEMRCPRWALARRCQKTQLFSARALQGRNATRINDTL